MSNPIKIVNPEEAVSCVKSNQRIFIHGSAATPLSLLDALADRKYELKNVEVVSIMQRKLLLKLLICFRKYQNSSKQ